MGADVMRWQYCAQPPDRNLLFGFGPAHEIKRKLLTFWNSVKFLVDYAQHRGLRARRWASSSRRRRRAAPLDRWLVARTHELVREATEALRGDADRERDPRLRGVRRRSLELVHPPLAPAVLRRRRGRVPDALVRARAVAARDLAGDAVPRRPPLVEPRARRARPRCTSPAGRRWPSPTAALLEEIAEVRAVVELGRQARSDVRAQAAPAAAPADRRGRAARARLHADEIADELRVKSVEFGEVEASELRVKPNLPVLGPKLGTDAAARSARALADGRVRASSTAAASRSTATSSSRTTCSSSASASRAGSSRPTAASRSRSTRRSTTSCGSRRACNDLIRAVQVLRKEAGLEVTDRIRLWIPDEDLLAFSGPDRRRDARGLGRARPRAAAREGLSASLLLRVGERELAAQLDRQAELDVLLEEAVLLDVGDAARAEPVADALDELLGRGGARGDADDSHVVRRTRPRRSRSRRRSGRTATPPARAVSTSRFEFDELREPITSSRSISVEQLLDGPLPVRGRVTDVLASAARGSRGTARGAR